MAKKDSEYPTIHVESMVGQTDKKPAVLISWGEMAGMLSPDEARAHALKILQAAEASVQDAAVYKMTIDQARAAGDINGPKIAGHMVASIREARREFEAQDGK